MTHTENAVKIIKKATPTVNEDGNVIKWDIEVEYSFNEYTSEYSKSVDVDPIKVPSDYSKAELWQLAKESHLDQVFESQYVSVKLAEGPTVETISNFDVDSLD